MSHPPQLRLLSHPVSVSDHTTMHADVDSARLWDLLHDSTVHTILKRSALHELARRRDPELMEHCESLLQSDTRSDWCLGVATLAALATPEAVDRLILVFAKSLGENRTYVLDSVAHILTADFVKPFSIMVREVTRLGELDVSGWTRVAVSTLTDVCKRFGIEVISKGDTDSGHESMDEVMMFTEQ